MCIIYDKPAGVDMIDDEDIKYMFQKNPNGAGFALQGWFKTTGRDGKERKTFKVVYHKGFMDVDDLIEALGPKDKLKDLRVVIHCRITTSGDSDKPTTHPFPLSNNYGELRVLDGEGPVLFHNGVFSELGGIIDKKSSDTQDYTVGIANRMLKDPRHISKISRTIAEKVAGSCRVLILYPDPNHPEFRLGTWHEHEGSQYSNTGYRGYYTAYSGYNSYNSYYNKPKEETKTKSVFVERDIFGCNSAAFATPDNNEHWISFQNRERMEAVLENAKVVTTDKEGNTFYYFNYDQSIGWKANWEDLEIYDEEGATLIKDMEDEILMEEYDENVIFFTTQDEMLEWCTEEARRVGDYEFFYNGEYWFLDTNDLAAYTEKGLALCYKSGEVGHVKKALKKDGYDSYNNDLIKEEEIPY